MLEANGGVSNFSFFGGGGGKLPKSTLYKISVWGDQLPIPTRLNFWTGGTSPPPTLTCGHNHNWCF